MNSVEFLKQECNWRCRCCHKSKRASLQIWSKADTVIIARDEREGYVLTTQSTSKVHKQGNLNILLGGIIILTKSWNAISQCSTSHFSMSKLLFLMSLLQHTHQGLGQTINIKLVGNVKSICSQISTLTLSGKESRISRGSKFYGSRVEGPC